MWDGSRVLRRAGLGMAAAMLMLAPGLTAQETPKKSRGPNVGGLDQPGATLTGVVKFRGEKPPRKPIADLLGNAFCKEACKGVAPLAEEWVFGKNGADDTLQNVLVYVKRGLEKRTFDPPKDPVVLDQVKCVYTPHVVGVLVGQTLEIRNSDDTLHNVRSDPRLNRPFNDGMGGRGKLEKVFRFAELKIPVRCNMHQWMLAYVHVLSHPFYAVTQEDGTFTLRGLPPGEYEIAPVHESPQLTVQPAEAVVKLAAGETKTIEFTYQVGK